MTEGTEARDLFNFPEDPLVATFRRECEELDGRQAFEQDDFEEREERSREYISARKAQKELEAL
jgi:hypothetical protein